MMSYYPRYEILILFVLVFTLIICLILYIINRWFIGGTVKFEDVFS